MSKRTLIAGVCVSLAATLAAGCGSEAASHGSSSRGSSSHTKATSVDDVYVVPLFVPGRCSLQVGRIAELRFTITNSRPTESERLFAVSTDVANLVRISPNDVIEIPPGASVTAGQPINKFDPATNRKPLEVDLVGIDPNVRPGISVEITFQFDRAGEVSMRVPVDACPAQP